MSHDLLAELKGYRNELAGAEQYGKDEKATAVKAQIKRVEGQIRERVDELLADAHDHVDGGRDVAAAEATVEARRLSAALEEDKPAPENAAPSAPKERAVGKKAGTT